jgi:hypothetical protein
MPTHRVAVSFYRIVVPRNFDLLKIMGFEKNKRVNPIHSERIVR